MHAKQRNEVLAGLLTLATIVTGLGIVLWMGGVSLNRPAATAVFYCEETAGATGLTVGSPVQINDQPIGKIAEIRFDGNTKRTLYVAHLETKLTVHSDAQARVATALLGAPPLVLTHLGTAEAATADLEHPVPIAGGLNSAMAGLESAAGDVAAITRAFRAEIDPQNGGMLLQQVKKIIVDLQSVSDHVVRIAGRLDKESDSAAEGSLLAKAHASMNDINTVTADARPKVDRILTDVEQTAGLARKYMDGDVGTILARMRDANNQILEAAGDIRDLSRQAKNMLAMNRDNVDTIIDNMTAVSANLKAMAVEVRRQPWRLLGKPSDQETRQQDIYEAARAFADGATRLDAAVSRLNGLVEANPGGLPADTAGLQDVLTNLQESYDRFSKVENALWQELKGASK